MVTAGQLAPEFTLPDSDMERVRLTAFRDQRNVVVYFYPKDDTSGCTLEAVDFSDLVEEFEALDTVILGISRDDCGSHARFKEKHGITVRLLADIDGEVCEAYGVWQEKEKEGVKRMGIVRSTFVIDKRGEIVHALYRVNAVGHAKEVLERVRTLSSG